MSCCFRPIRESDREEVIQLALLCTEGLTSMPKDRNVLNAKIDQALSTFQDPKALMPHERRFLFVLEKDEQIMGFSAITSAFAGPQPCLVLDEELRPPALAWQTLSPSYSEICSLYLHPLLRRQKDGHGKMLSFGRFFYIYLHKELFSPTLLARLRGWIQRDGTCPFWTQLCSFCGSPQAKSLDFSSIHAQIARGGQVRDLITEELPALTSFSELVQSYLGRAHPQTQAAEHLLQVLGFKKMKSFDALDGGPHYEAALEKMPLFEHLKKYQITRGALINPSSFMVLMPGADFKIRLVKAGVDGDNQTLFVDEELEPGCFEEPYVLGLDLDKLH